MKLYKTTSGCCALLAVIAILGGAAAMAFGYWHDARFPGKPMTPTWNGLLLTLLPLLAGLMSIILGVLVGMVTLLAWLLGSVLKVCANKTAEPTTGDGYDFD